MAEQITIRCINTQTQRVKELFPSIANNKQLMKNAGYVISDPNYEAKMEAIRNKVAFSQNGQAKLPAQESFAPKPEPVKTEPAIPQTKNEIITPAITDEPKVKRTRRTKAQMEELKKQTA